MGLSRVEVNLRRLLAKCELKIKTKEKHDIKFPKYIDSLEDMLYNLDNATEKPAEETRTEYQKRIESLKFHLGLSAPEIATPQIDSSQNEYPVTPREQLLAKHSETQNLDELIDYHEDMQGRIADDMLKLTRNLKEQSELANRIIKKDTEIVGRSAQLTEQNFTKLKAESGKLEEHSKKAWKCWMWIMLLVVMVVFINMVLFMKVVKKK